MVKIKKVLRSLKNLTRNRKRLLALLLVILISVFLLLFQRYQKENIVDREIIQATPYDIVTHSTEKPSEKEVKEYVVPPDMPRELNLKSIDKRGYIQPVGVDQHGNIAVPSNVLMAGWYVNSAKPGDKGLSIITGHRDGVMKKGVFRYLGDLKEGDLFEIEYGDGSIRNFKVLEIRVASIEDTYDIMYEKKENVESQLNLITCSGDYDKEAETYDKRTTVISEGI
jgi:LPXTG-site transpeptidase (sortase) family protein